MENQNNMNQQNPMSGYLAFVEAAKPKSYGRQLAENAGIAAVTTAASVAAAAGTVGLITWAYKKFGNNNKIRG